MPAYYCVQNTFYLYIYLFIHPPKTPILPALSSLREALTPIQWISSQQYCTIYLAGAFRMYVPLMPLM